MLFSVARSRSASERKRERERESQVSRVSFLFQRRKASPARTPKLGSAGGEVLTVLELIFWVPAMGQALGDTCCAALYPEENDIAVCPVVQSSPPKDKEIASTMAMSMPPPEPSAAFAPAPVPAPETEAVSSEGIARLLDMGFGEEASRLALIDAHGNVEQALQMLTSAAAVEADPKIEQLVAMGFSEDQARNALDGAGGDLERAANYLMSSSP
ncbi:unnamed protein product [Effrenium voratum]|nr:unnamed protein product [Effrenium voratum]